MRMGKVLCRLFIVVTRFARMFETLMNGPIVDGKLEILVTGIQRIDSIIERLMTCELGE